MQSVIIILYVSVSLLLVLVIMLQPGKGSGLGAIGGGGGGASMFGARGAAGFLGKLTGWLAALFMILALTMARMSLDTGSITPVAKTTSTGEFGGASNSSSLDETAGAEKPADAIKAVEPAKNDETAKPTEAKPAEAKPAEAKPAAEAEKPAAE